MSRGTKSKVKEREDFSYLLRKKPSKGKGKKARSTAKNPTSTAPSLWRQKLFSDEKVCYIIVPSQNEIHDKHCKLLKDYKDDEIIPAEELGAGSYTVCRECAIRTYTRYGAIDYEEYRRYERFFAAVCAAMSNIHDLYWTWQCRTKLIGPSKMWVHCNEDSWEIELTNVKHRICLYHNSYHVNEDGTRTFYNDFHLQKENCTFYYALSVIFDYKFGPEHITHLPENDDFSMSDSPEQTAWDVRWEQKFARAEEFYEGNGHLNVPYRYISEDGTKLGVWISVQRRHYNYPNQYLPLTECQIQKLESIGMVWDAKAGQWETKYQAAKAYFDEHGDIEVPIRYITEDGVRLGSWVARQRKKVGASDEAQQLTKEQIAKLKNIGIV